MLQYLCDCITSCNIVKHASIPQTNPFGVCLIECTCMYGVCLSGRDFLLCYQSRLESYHSLSFSLSTTLPRCIYIRRYFENIVFVYFEGFRFLNYTVPFVYTQII